MGTMAMLKDNARNQRGHSAYYHGFKLAICSFVLSILDVDLYSHIPQALRFYYNFKIASEKKDRINCVIRHTTDKNVN